MLKSVRDLYEMGYDLYASKGTADFYQGKDIKIQSVDWPFEEGTGNAVTTTNEPE
jgi:carbamoyl-phosphate synthase/aspartate carbamoyltransferase/dihydroorotase